MTKYNKDVKFETGSFMVALFLKLNYAIIRILIMTKRRRRSETALSKLRSVVTSYKLSFCLG